MYVPDEPTPSSYRSRQKLPRHRRRAPSRCAPPSRPGPGTGRLHAPGAGGSCALVLLAAVLLSAVISGLIYLRPPTQSLVVASVPYWNLNYGTASVLANPHTFSEMSPWMYGLDNSGQIVPQYAAAQAAAVEAQLARLRAAQIPLVPTIANVVAGTLGLPAASSPASCTTPRCGRSTSRRSSPSCSGSTTRASTSTTRTCAPATGTPSPPSSPSWPTHCTPRARCCRSTCSRRRATAATTQRNLAQDYHAIGQVADQVRLMGYDYHWADLGARAGRAHRLDPCRAPLRQDPDPRQQDHSWRPALRLRLGRRTTARR